MSALDNIKFKKEAIPSCYLFSLLFFGLSESLHVKKMSTRTDLPESVFVWKNQVLFGDTGNHRVRKILPNGSTVTTQELVFADTMEMINWQQWLNSGGLIASLFQNVVKFTLGNKVV